MARAATSTGAESIRWDLSDLFASPTDPALEATLAKALDFARSFETRYRGKLGSLEPHDFAGMMAELEVAEETAIKPEVYAYLLHSQNTQDPGAGRLLARVREAAADLSWAPPPAEKAAFVLDLPGAEGVLNGIALAVLGYRPVPLYNAIPLPYGARLLNHPVKRRCHPADHRVPNPALDIFDDLPRRALVPASIEGFDREPELDEQVV